MPQVSLKDIYEIVERLETKIDRRLVEAEKKIDKLEDFNSRAMGVWFAITTIISIGSSWIIQRIFKP